MNKHLRSYHPIHVTNYPKMVSECGMFIGRENTTRYYMQVTCKRCKDTKRYKEWMSAKRKRK